VASNQAGKIGKNGDPLPGKLAVSRMAVESSAPEWACALDSPQIDQVIVAGKALAFTGWIIHRRRPVVGVRVVREDDGSEVGVLKIGISRDGVAKAHARIKHAATSGFRGKLKFDRAGIYRIECTVDDQQWTPMFTFALRDPSQQPTRLLFMHIAKTAGTSVNRFLSDNAGTAHCAFHLEIDPRWRSPEGRAQLATVPVISGHITYPAFKRRLDCADYVKATILRTPLEHLISHLAFIRHLMEPSEKQRLAGHSPSIQSFAAKLVATDFGKAESVRALVDNLIADELVLVDNLQVRYLSSVAPGARVQRAQLDEARHALNEFDIVGFTDQLERFLGDIAAWREWPQPTTIPRENQQAKRYGLDTDDPAIVAAFQPLVQYDEKLYRYARKVFAEGKNGPVRRLQKNKKKREGDLGLRQQKGPRPVAV
jgi:hypothetical protein